MKGLRINKTVIELKSKGAWGELEAKHCIQRQLFTNCLRLILVFMRNSALRKSLISVFQEFFASINKIFILVERLGTRLLFYEVLRIS